MFEFGESSGKLGLKMTNRTHTEKWCDFLILCVVVLYLILIIFINRRTLEWSGE